MVAKPAIWHFARNVIIMMAPIMHVYQLVQDHTKYVVQMDKKNSPQVEGIFYLGLSDFVGSIVSDGLTKTGLPSAVLAGCVFLSLILLDMFLIDTEASALTESSSLSVVHAMVVLSTKIEKNSSFILIL